MKNINKVVYSFTTKSKSSNINTNTKKEIPITTLIITIEKDGKTSVEVTHEFSERTEKKEKSSYISTKIVKSIFSYSYNRPMILLDRLYFNLTGSHEVTIFYGDGYNSKWDFIGHNYKFENILYEEDFADINIFYNKYENINEIQLLNKMYKEKSTMNLMKDNDIYQIHIKTEKFMRWLISIYDSKLEFEYINFIVKSNGDALLKIDYNNYYEDDGKFIKVGSKFRTAKLTDEEINIIYRAIFLKQESITHDPPTYLTDYFIYHENGAISKIQENDFPDEIINLIYSIPKLNEIFSEVLPESDDEEYEEEN